MYTMIASPDRISGQLSRSNSIARAVDNFHADNFSPCRQYITTSPMNISAAAPASDHAKSTTDPRRTMMATLHPVTTRNATFVAHTAYFDSTCAENHISMEPTERNKSVAATIAV